MGLVRPQGVQSNLQGSSEHFSWVLDSGFNGLQSVYHNGPEREGAPKNRESFSECMNCEQCDPSKLAEPLASCSSPGFLLVTPSFLPSYGCHADSGKGEANDVDFKGTQTQRNYADTNHLGKNRLIYTYYHKIQCVLDNTGLYFFKGYSAVLFF